MLEIALNAKKTWNSKKKKKKIYFSSYSAKTFLNIWVFFYKKIIKKCKHHINIKNYTVHPHDMVHTPTHFRENIAMRLQCEN